MNEVRTKQVRVFVGGGYSFRTAGPAYRKAAWAVIRSAHCYCDIDVADGMSTTVVECRYHANAGYYGQRVVSRLARLWMRRDGVSSGQYRLACKYMENDWGNVPIQAATAEMEPKRQGWKFINQVAALRELARRHPEEYQGLMAATGVEEVLKR